MCLENIFTHFYCFFFFEGYCSLKISTWLYFDFYFREFSFFVMAEAIYSKVKMLIFDLQKLIEFEKNLGVGERGGKDLI